MIAMIGVACSSSGSSSSTDSGGDDNDDGSSGIETNEQVLANIPDANPTSIDYSLNSASAQVAKSAAPTKPGGNGGGEFEDADLRVRIIHTPGSGLGAFDIFVCADESQIAYAQYLFVDDTYEGTTYFRRDGRNLDIESLISTHDITDIGFVGEVIVSGDSTKKLIITGYGETQANTMQGVNGDYGMAAYWTSSAGCGRGTSPQGNTDYVPFEISVGADDSKTYSTSEDDELCSNVPDFIEAAENLELMNEEVWDCVIPDGEAIDLEALGMSASQLEDSGGDECQELRNSWGEASDRPEQCGDVNGAEGMGCLIDSLYAFGAQAVNRTQRMMQCKIRGVFGLVDEGTIADVALANGGEVYLEIQRIFGNDE